MRKGEHKLIYSEDTEYHIDGCFHGKEKNLCNLNEYMIQHLELEVKLYGGRSKCMNYFKS